MTSTTKAPGNEPYGSQSMWTAIGLLPTSWTINFIVSKVLEDVTNELLGWVLTILQALLLGALAFTAVRFGVKELRHPGTHAKGARGKAVAGIIIASIVYPLILAATVVVIVLQYQ